MLGFGIRGPLGGPPEPPSGFRWLRKPSVFGSRGTPRGSPRTSQQIWLALKIFGFWHQRTPRESPERPAVRVANVGCSGAPDAKNRWFHGRPQDSSRRGQHNVYIVFCQFFDFQGRAKSIKPHKSSIFPHFPSQG